jgi:hypothetical protein
MQTSRNDDAMSVSDPKRTRRLLTHGERYRYLQRELSVGSAEVSLDLI